MNNFKKILNLSALISGLTLLGGWAVIATTACSDKEKTITIVATENPHTKILNFAEKLFNDDGWKLKIETVDGYYTANPSVSNGSADANYFQHKPFLDNYNDGQPDEDKLVDIVDVHLEPLGAYSQASAYHNNWAEIPNGAKIITSNSEGDFQRILDILIGNNLVGASSTLTNIDNSIKSLDLSMAFSTIDSPDPKQLITTYDYEQGNPIVFINGNFVLDSGEQETLRDHVVGYESVENNPYNNLVAVKQSNADTAKSKELIKVLGSYAVGGYIRDTWPPELVIPVHEYK